MFFSRHPHPASSSRRRPGSSSPLVVPAKAAHLVIPAKAPHFVIPAKAPTSSSRRKPGSSSLLFALVLECCRETRLTSLCFFARHPWRASHFLLLAQEKVTKEKGTPEGAVGGRAADCASPLRRFADGTSCAAANARASLRAPLRAFPAQTRRALGGPKVKSERESESENEVLLLRLLMLRPV